MMSTIGYLGELHHVVDAKATKALQFYEDCADNLPYYQTSEKDDGFDWDMCRAYCRSGKSYSHSRFMTYVAEWFGTTVKDMKGQWRNIRMKGTPLTGVHSGSSNNLSSGISGTTTTTTIWKGGWVTDNFSTYYLDENGVKHVKKPKDSY